MEESNLVSRDKAVIWHPYTQMQSFESLIPIVRGTGAYVIAADGKRYLDAISSWWVNLHGHAHPYIAQRVYEQLQTLEHVIFAGFTHPAAVELAERLLKILPPGQSKVFYSDNGSTAVEVAIKMCLQYWHNQAQPRLKILAFNRSYHGDTFGAMALSARSIFTKPFEKLLFEVTYIDPPSRANISTLLDNIALIRNDLAAFIYEPLVQGTSGMLMHEAAYLDLLIQACKKEGVFCIADEVMTGFGRTGKLFASSYLKEVPDLICLSKGLTGGAMALGVTSCSQKVYDAFLSEDKTKTLFHGHSYTANPVACSAALASMDILLESQTLDSIERIQQQHAGFKAKIEHHAKLKEVRHLGTIIAFEWNSKEDVSYLSNLRDRLYQFFLKSGIILRPLGNIVYILPPYCITNQELAYIYACIEKALEEIG